MARVKDSIVSLVAFIAVCSGLQCYKRDKTIETCAVSPWGETSCFTGVATGRSDNDTISMNDVIEIARGCQALCYNYTGLYYNSPAHGVIVNGNGTCCNTDNCNNVGITDPLCYQCTSSEAPGCGLAELNTADPLVKKTTCESGYCGVVLINRTGIVLRGCMVNECVTGEDTKWKVTRCMGELCNFASLDALNTCSNDTTATTTTGTTNNVSNGAAIENGAGVMVLAAVQLAIIASKF